MVIKCSFFVMIFHLWASQSFGQPELKILPLGNSITQGTMCQNGSISGCNDLGGGQQIGYRYKLKNLLTATGYNSDYIGNYQYGYFIMQDSDNGGFGGITDERLADIVETGSTSAPYGSITPGPYLNTYQPDIILLHIGTNDILSGPAFYSDVSDVERILDAVDDFEAAYNKTVVVFLARIISRKYNSCNSDAAVRTYNNLLTNMAQSRINSGDDIVIVDMECEAGMDYFEDMIDEVHPSVSGYEKMADKWFEAIDNYNTAPIVGQIPDQIEDKGSSFSQISLDAYVSDVEDNPYEISWSISPANPQNFHIDIDAGRRVSIIPKDSDWSGSETIEFIATDTGNGINGFQKSGSCLVTFTVGWAPVITGQNPIDIPEGTPYEVTMNDLIVSDPENVPEDIEIILQPGANYSVSGAVITPDLHYHGSLLVPVQIKNGAKISDAYNLLITVYQVYFPPVITSTPEVFGRTNDPYIYQMSAIDSNPEDLIIFSAIKKPVWMTVNSSSGLVSGTPTKLDVGVSEVILSVSDGVYDVQQIFNLQIAYYNHPPEILSEPKDSAFVTEAYTYRIVASDAENDPLTYFTGSIPDWMVFNESGNVLIGVPGQEDLGSHSIVLGVTDLFATTYQTFNLTVRHFTDVLQIETSHLIKLYPIPVTNSLFIELDSEMIIPGGISFELFDATGQKVLQNQLNSSQVEIDFLSKDLHNGIYLFRILDTEKNQIIHSGKIIVRLTGE